MSKIPCPNPVCTHDFAPSEIQKSGGALKCPRCGQTFQFGSAPAKPPVAAPKPAPAIEKKPAAPMGGASWLSAATKPKSATPAPIPTPPRKTASTPVPPAKPKPARTETAKPRQTGPKVKESVPLAEPIEAAPIPSPAAPVGEDFFNPTAVSGPLIRSVGSSGRSGWTWPKFAILGSVGGILVALAYLFLPLFYRHVGDSGGSRGTPFTGKLRNLKDVEEKFVRITVPPGAWKVDELSDSRFNLKEILAAQLAFVNDAKNQEGWVAISGRDFGTQLPAESDLQREAVQRLTTLFQNQFEFKNATDIRFMGEKAQSITFRGILKEVQWSGECVTLGYQGFGYWFFFAAPQESELQPLKEDLVERIQLVTDRTGWRPREVDLDRFVSNSKRITIDSPRDRWVRHDPAEELDKGDMELHSKKPKESKDNIKNIAVVTVLMLERGNDLTETLKLTRDYFQSKQTADFKIEPEGATRMEEVAERKAIVGEFRLIGGGDSLKYYLMTVVHDNDRAFAIRCECDYRYKELWTSDFKDLLNRVRLGAAP